MIEILQVGDTVIGLTSWGIVALVLLIAAIAASGKR